MSIFKLTDEDSEKVNNWIKEHKQDKNCKYSIPNGQKTGAIGGAYTYSFTPTSIGTIKKVECACGVEFNFTNFDLW